MQRCGEVCHSVFALSVFASRLRGRGCFDQHFILPARRYPLPPLHAFEPHHIRPTHQIVFLRQGVGAAGRAAQTIDLKTKVDPAVLGVIRLDIEGTELDGTVQNRLAALRRDIASVTL